MVNSHNLQVENDPFIVKANLGGGFKYCLFSTRIPGEMIQFDEHYVSIGLVQPSTRNKHDNGKTQPFDSYVIWNCIHLPLTLVIFHCRVRKHSMIVFFSPCQLGRAFRWPETQGHLSKEGDRKVHEKTRRNLCAEWRDPKFLWDFYTHRMHVWYIFLHENHIWSIYFFCIYHKNQPTDQLQANIPTIHGYYAGYTWN